MVDKNLFIQDLKEVYTVLQELKIVEKTTLKLIDIINGLETITPEEFSEIKTYINSIKDYVIQNENTTEIGGNLEVDGNVKLNSNVIIEGNITHNFLTKVYQKNKYDYLTSVDRCGFDISNVIDNEDNLYFISVEYNDTEYLGIISSNLYSTIHSFSISNVTDVSYEKGSVLYYADEKNIDIYLEYAGFDENKSPRLTVYKINNFII